MSGRVCRKRALAWVPRGRESLAENEDVPTKVRLAVKMLLEMAR